MRTKTKIAWLIIVLLNLIPLILWALGPGNNNLNNYQNISYAIGQISGIIGMNMFAIAFILAGRIKKLEDIFGGLDQMYIAHATVGTIALISLLIHPILLVIKYIPQNIPRAVKYLLPGKLLSVDLGIYALLGLILIISTTFYLKIKYQYWKFIHRFIGPIFILATLHVFLVRTSVAQNYIFTGYYAYATIVSLIGILGYLYSSFFRLIIFPPSKYQISKIIRKNQTWDITLRPLGKALKYKAGQFIFVSFKNQKISKESHPFSLASAENNENLRIIIKNLGDYTSQISELKVGDYAKVDGAYGRFYANKSDVDQIWLAAGIGITPFIGIANSLNPNMKNKITLYYCVNCETELLNKHEFKKIQKRNKNFKMVHWMSDKNGFLTLKQVKKINKITNDKEYYLCGPEAFKQSFIRKLVKEGIAKKQIHQEDFTFK